MPSGNAASLATRVRRKGILTIFGQWRHSLNSARIQLTPDSDKDNSYRAVKCRVRGRRISIRLKTVAVHLLILKLQHRISLWTVRQRARQLLGLYAIVARRFSVLVGYKFASPDLSLRNARCASVGPCVRFVLPTCAYQ